MKKGRLIALALSLVLVAMDVMPVMADEANDVSGNEIVLEAAEENVSEDEIYEEINVEDEKEDTDDISSYVNEAELDDEEALDDVVSNNEVSENSVSDDSISENTVSEDSVSSDEIVSDGSLEADSLNEVVLKIGNTYLPATKILYYDSDYSDMHAKTPAVAPAKIQVPKGKLSKLMFPYVKKDDGSYVTMMAANFDDDCNIVCSTGMGGGIGYWNISQTYSGMGDPYDDNTYARITEARDLFAIQDGVQFEGVEVSAGQTPYLIYSYAQYLLDAQGRPTDNWLYSYAFFEIEILDEDPTYVNPSILDPNYMLVGNVDNNTVWHNVRKQLWENKNTAVIMDEAAKNKLKAMANNYSQNKGQDWIWKYIFCYYDDWSGMEGWEGDYMFMHGNLDGILVDPEEIIFNGRKYYRWPLSFMAEQYTNYSWTTHRDREEYVENYVSNLTGPGGALDKSKYHSDYERIKAAFDWVTSNISYESGYNSNPEALYYHAYAAFSKKKGSCEGMAQAYMYICRKLGVKVRMLYDKNMHVYNMVSLDGKWYVTDCSGKKLLKGKGYSGATLNSLLYGAGSYDYTYFVNNYFNKMAPYDYGLKGGFTAETFYVVKGKKVKTFAGSGTNFKSSKTSVATVDKKGKVTAKSVGTTKISCKVSGKTVSCKVKVVNKPTLTGVKTLKRGKSKKFKVKGGGGETIWTSSNPAVACVDAKGKVTAIGKGSAKITAVNCGVKMSIKIKVK